MTFWNKEQLDRIGGAQAMHIAGRRRDGSLRKPVIVWMVRSGDDLYTRSVARSATLKLLPQTS